MIRQRNNHALSVRKALKALSSDKGCGLIISERDGRTHIRLIGETGRALQIIQMALTENPFLNAMAQHVAGPRVTLKSNETTEEGTIGTEEGGTPDSEPIEYSENPSGGDTGGNQGHTEEDK